MSSQAGGCYAADTGFSYSSFFWGVDIQEGRAVDPLCFKRQANLGPQLILLHQTEWESPAVLLLLNVPSSRVVHRDLEKCCAPGH